MKESDKNSPSRSGKSVRRGPDSSGAHKAGANRAAGSDRTARADRTQASSRKTQASRKPDASGKPGATGKPGVSRTSQRSGSTGKSGASRKQQGPGKRQPPQQLAPGKARKRSSAPAKRANQRRPQPSADGRIHSSTKRAAAGDNRVRADRMRHGEQRRIREEQARKQRQRLILVILVAAIVVIGLLGKFVLGQVQGKAKADAVVPTAQFSPQACSKANVIAKIEPAGVVTGGKASDFNVVLRNTSTTNPCYIDVGWEHMNVTMVSGSQTMAVTSECKSGAASKMLLLDRGMETTTVVTWNGAVGAGCGNPAATPASDGTYVAELSFKDLDITESATFQVN